MAYDPTEQDTLMDVFTTMLRSVTRDGGRKRAKGEKPPWWRDAGHEPAIWSHINKWKHGEHKDLDSGVHPLVHLAWRALAIAYQEMYGQIDPAGVIKYQELSSSDIRCFTCGASVFDGADHSQCRGTA